MDEQNDFESRARKAVSDTRGRMASDAAFGEGFVEPQRYDRSSASKKTPPKKREQPTDPPGLMDLARQDRAVFDDLEGSQGLEYEIHIQIRNLVFVLTPSKDRAAKWCGVENHVGITPSEIRVLTDATSHSQLSYEYLRRLADVKQIFPGSSVIGTRGEQYE